jgi:hypothetical protein
VEDDSGGCRFEVAQGVRATGRRARSEKIGKQALSGPFAGMKAPLDYSLLLLRRQRSRSQ